MWNSVGVCALVALCGCAADDVDGDVMLERRFAVRPMRLFVAEDVPQECLDSLIQAVFWYRERAATLTLERVDGANPALNGFVIGGAVGVIVGKLADNVRGSTRIALTAGGDILAAEITLAFCDALTVAHECGHGLGLEHVRAHGNLMYRATERGGWALTDEQLTWIADDPLSTSVNNVTTQPMRWDSVENVEVIDCFADEQ